MSLLHAYLGSLIADALAMPGHWYYDREALRRDYGVLDHYQVPRNPHPGSILWRSEYHYQFDAGIIANAMVGGDNCHRGAVVGCLLAAENPIDERWIAGLRVFRDAANAV
jgi:hypothetical protein